MPRKTAIVLSTLFLLLVWFVVDFTQTNTSQETRGVTEKDEVLKAAISPTASEQAVNAISVSPAVSGDYYPVRKVVDGDTIVVQMNGQEQTVRLIGVNTPESVDPRRPVECFGIEASNKAKEFLSGQQVALKSDPTQSDRDRYNRLLRYVYLPDGTFINQRLIEEGVAYEYTYDVPYEFQSQFRESQTRAEKEKKGLWGDPSCAGQNIRKSVESKQKPVAIIDKDCSDFSSRQEAQLFYESQGGPAEDPHRLDVDKNGQACESLD